MVDELGIPVQGVIGEEGLDAAAPAAAALRAAAAQAHVAELAAAGAGAAIEFAVDEKAQADAVADHEAGGPARPQRGIALRQGEGHGAGVVVEEDGQAEPLPQARRQGQVAGAEDGAPGDDALPRVDVALAREADGLDVGGRSRLAREGQRPSRRSRP